MRSSSTWATIFCPKDSLFCCSREPKNHGNRSPLAQHDAETLKEALWSARCSRLPSAIDQSTTLRIPWLSPQLIRDNVGPETVAVASLTFSGIL